jgi:hypothetical protein
MPSLTPRRKFKSILPLVLTLICFCFRPKIQRLVTPLRLQRRRHLRAVKRKRIESQKEQKAEFE